MPESLEEEVARLLGGIELDPTEVSSIRDECARLAAAHLSGYTDSASISKARQWAESYRRCQEWLDDHPPVAKGSS